MAPGLVDSTPFSQGTGSLSRLTADYDEAIYFYLNGTKVILDAVDPEITLLEYLRGIGLTGTKLGCAEGGCGACTVVVSQINPTTGQIYHASVNACLAPLVSVDGKHVVTVEGIGNTENPHPAQQRIAMANGSQCGFCTPGIVMVRFVIGKTAVLHVDRACEGRIVLIKVRCRAFTPFCATFQSPRSLKSRRRSMAIFVGALATGLS